MRTAYMIVEINCDPIPGTYHTEEDHSERLQAMLTDRFPWYKPKVTLVTDPAIIDDLKQITEMVITTPDPSDPFNQ